MKIFFQKIYILSFLAILLPVLVFAASPGIPHKFYGTVHFASGSTPDGLSVEAKINNVTVGSSVTTNGNYGYGNLLLVTDNQNTNTGKTIEFYVSGIKANETAIFSNGASTNLNLTVPGTIGSITKAEGVAIENETVAVASTSPMNIKMGESLNVTISSATNTNATIEKIKKESSGNVAVFSGKIFLNAYDIKISGASLNISVTMKYDDTGIDENTITPYRFNGTSWVAITPFTIDKTANTITFTISSGQTVYGVFGSVLAQSSPTPTPSGGGGGGSYIPPVTATSTLSAEAQKVDSNKDNKIDILDFNTLMVHWGETSLNNIADFNKDNKVDIFDFNLLMIYWTV